MEKPVVSYRDAIVSEIIMRKLTKTSCKTTELEDRILCYQCLVSRKKGGELKNKEDSVSKYFIEL